MKSKAIGLVLLLGGVSIGTIAFVGNKKVNEKSDIEILQEIVAEQAQTREQQLAQLIEAPASCAGVPLAAFDRVCQNEVYEEETVIPWATGIEPGQAACIEASYRKVDERIHLIQRREFDAEKPLTDWVVIHHACDVTGDLLLWVEEIDPEEPGLQADDALNAWHRYKKAEGAVMSY